MNYRFLTTVVFFNLISKAICSDCIDFCLQLCFSEKGKNTHETFHILKMKTHFEKEPHFENGSSFQNPF